jgi:hypothetical protein
METFSFNITDLVFQGAGILVFKIPILILLFVYIIFTFIVIQRVNALNRTINVVAAHASRLLQVFAVIQFFLAISLFLLCLVIV